MTNTGASANSADPVPYADLPDRAAPDVFGDQHQYDAVQVTLEEMPQTVTLGEEARFIVALQNPTDNPIRLAPCPSFYMAYGENETVVNHKGRLNCREAPSALPAHGRVRFEMKLPIKGGEPYLRPGFVGSFFWRLTAARQPDSAHWGPVALQ